MIRFFSCESVTLILIAIVISSFTTGYNLNCKQKFSSCPTDALFWAVVQRVVVIPYRCFGTTYPSSRVQNSWIRDPWRWKR